MVSLVESLEDKYGEDEEEDQAFAFIVFVSCSPEAKRGLLPHVITLNDYNIGQCRGFLVAFILVLVEKVEDEALKCVVKT
jgi:hypothetical protein